jgi:hypothetical protein
MRLLSATQSSGLLVAVSGALSRRSVSPFAFVEARILSGEEEAVFGWLSLNHLLDSDSRGRPTAGWLDLGGASTQVGHALAEGAAASAEAIRDSEVVFTMLPPLAPGATAVAASPAPAMGSATSHLVFRRSYLRFGKEEAFVRSCRILAQQALDQMPALVAATHISQAAAATSEMEDEWEALQAGVAHPCLLQGDSLTVNWPSLARSLHGHASPDRRLQALVRAARSRQPSHRSLGASGPANASSAESATPGTARDMPGLLFYGTGRAKACERLMSQLISSHDDLCSAASPAPPSPRWAAGISSADADAGPAQAEAAPPYEGCDLSRHSLRFEGSFYGSGNYYYAALQLGLATPDGVYEVTPRDYATAAAVVCARDADSAREHWAASPWWNETGAGAALEWNNARCVLWLGWGWRGGCPFFQSPHPASPSAAILRTSPFHPHPLKPFVRLLFVRVSLNRHHPSSNLASVRPMPGTLASRACTFPASCATSSRCPRRATRS